MNKKDISVPLIKAYTDKCKDIILFDETSSTNTVAKEYAKNGADEYTVIISKRQTGGRGRMGRSFFSPDGGIYMSIILRPQVSADKSLLITTAAADAVVFAIEDVFGIECKIKWVNDIIKDGKKVCGILTEAAISPENSQLEYAVLGIGINLYPAKQEFPEEISSIAGTVLEKECSADKKAVFIAKVIDRVYDNCIDLSSCTFAERYRSKVMGIGKEISVIKADSVKTATALSVDGDMRLVVRYEDGKTEALSSGEVSTKL